MAGSSVSYVNLLDLVELVLFSIYTGEIFFVLTCTFCQKYVLKLYRFEDKLVLFLSRTFLIAF